jgi:hypothetical protein
LFEGDAWRPLAAEVTDLGCKGLLPFRKGLEEASRASPVTVLTPSMTRRGEQAARAM